MIPIKDWKPTPEQKIAMEQADEERKLMAMTIHKRHEAAKLKKSESKKTSK